MYYLISDTHFFHKNIIKYTNRPEDCDKLMIKNWIKTIKDNDEIIHLGDLCLVNKDNETKLQNLFKILPGKKHLILGNHDTKDKDFYHNLGFINVSDYLILDDIFLTHYPLEVSIYDSKETRDKQIELMDIFNENKLKYLIHGHSHRNKPRYKFALNVCVENIDYKPIELDKCITALKNLK